MIKRRGLQLRRGKVKTTSKSTRGKKKECVDKFLGGKYRDRMEKKRR